MVNESHVFIKVIILLLLMDPSVGIYVSATRWSTYAPPYLRGSRWDKDDENTNKTAFDELRQQLAKVVATKVIRSHSVSYDDTPQAISYPTPPREWLSVTTMLPESRKIKRFMSSNLWGRNLVSVPPRHRQGVAITPRSGRVNLAFKQASRFAASRNSNSSCSSPYRYGPNCEGICHCSTLLACDKTTGACRSGICAHGYMDPPMCQRPCPTGQFGFRCGFYCHCWKGAPCDSVNGFCAPNGRCAEEWFGPSCQIRKLELSDAPFVSVASCENITISWRQWNAELDFGNPEIVVRNYELEIRTPSRPQWRSIYRVLNSDESVKRNTKDPVVFVYTPSPDTRFYQFRVIVNGMDTNGKYVPGVPSIPTEVFQRNCPTEYVDGFTIVPNPSRPTVNPPVTLPPIVTPIASTPAGSTTATGSTTPTTTTPSVQVAEFDVSNDPNNPGNVIVKWIVSPPDQALQPDAGILVEVLGIGDCDPFQSVSEGPHLFRLTNSSAQTLRLERWRQYRVTLLRSLGDTDLKTAMLAKKSVVTTGNLPSAAPENIQLEDVASRLARLSWSPLACQHRGDSNVTFEVRLFRTPRTTQNKNETETRSARTRPSSTSTVATTAAAYKTISTNKTWVTFRHLSPAYNYIVEINARNRFGAGPSNHIQFTTPTEEHPRPAPQFMPPSSITPTSFTIEWQVSPASPGLVYPSVTLCELKVTPADSVMPVVMEQYVNCSTTSRTVTGLRPYTRYLVELTQTTDDKSSAYQTIIVSTPEAAPGEPVGITFRSYNKTCGEIDWDSPDPPNGVIANYTMILTIIDTFMPLRQSSVARYSQKNPGQLVCNLMLSTRYKFSVRAATGAGVGPSGEITFWTPIAEPLPPPVPFARLSENDGDNIENTNAEIIVLAQPVPISTAGNITTYYLKLATNQQLKEYETMYGVSTNGSTLYVPPDTKVDAALGALPGRLIERIEPSRFEQRSGSPLLYQTVLQVPRGQVYLVVWAVGVQLQDDSRIAAALSEQIFVPSVEKPVAPSSTAAPTTAPTTVPITTTTTAISTTMLSTATSHEHQHGDDGRVDWILGIVIALIILLIIVVIIIIILCCCWKRFDVPTKEEKQVVKWNSSEHVQTEDPPLQLEDWFNPTTQIDDSRYVVRGQRILTPTRYTTTVITPR